MSMLKPLGAITAAALLFVAVQVQAAEGDAAAGESLYKASCMPCHKEKPGNMVGKPVAELVAKSMKYKNMDNPTGSVEKMQKAMKALSDQQITDIATYLSGLKK